MTDTYAPAGGSQPTFSGPQPQQDPENPPLTAADVTARWEQADRYLLRDRLNYQLNQSFAIGEQWVQPNGRTLEELIATPTELQSRTTIDKFGPRTRSLTSRLAPNELAFESQAEGTDDVSRSRARTREQLAKGEHHQQDWEDIREDTLLDTLYGATAAICVDWDRDGGTADDEITDPFTGFSYPSGQAKLTPLSILEFTLQPGVARQDDALWWIRLTALPPSVVRDIYKLPKEPTADAAAVITARQRTMLTDLYQSSDALQKQTAVYRFYERPCTYSAGQVLTVVNGEVIRQEPWTFPWKRLNLYVFRAGRFRGRWTGTTLLNTARSCQWAFNQIRSTILEHARKAANVRLMIPEGSVSDDDLFTDDPGSLVRYNPVEGQAPHYMEAPQVARWLSQEADRLSVDMDDIFHTHDVTRGQAPGDRNSGLALSILAEKDDTPLTFIARDQAKGWGRITEMVLMLMAANREQGGTTTVTVGGTQIQVPWSPEDIGTNPRIVVPTTATMPHSKVAAQASLTNLLTAFPNLAASLDAVSVFRYLGVSDPEEFAATLDRDASLAQWENVLLSNGTPLVPMPYNKHSVHIVEHNGQRNTPDYQMLTPEQQQAMEAHVAAHEQMSTQEHIQQAQLEAGAPGASALPQANAPPGSELPPTAAEQQAAIAPPPPMGQLPSPVPM